MLIKRLCSACNAKVENAFLLTRLPASGKKGKCEECGKDRYTYQYYLMTRRRYDERI